MKTNTFRTSTNTLPNTFSEKGIAVNTELNSGCESKPTPSTPFIHLKHMRPRTRTRARAAETGVEGVEGVGSDNAAKSIIIAEFMVTPAVPPGFMGRRTAKMLKQALRDKIDGCGLKCINIRTIDCDEPGGFCASLKGERGRETIRSGDALSPTIKREKNGKEPKPAAAVGGAK